MPHAKQAVYRYHAAQQDGWRFHYSTLPNVKDNWNWDGIAFLAPIQQANCVPVKQFYIDQKDTLGGWRFTYSLTQPETQGWTFNQIAFNAFENQQQGTIPIYRFYCKQIDGQRYLFSPKQEHKGWKQDGVAFYAYPVTSVNSA